MATDADDLDLRLLRALVRVADGGSFTAAAATAGISQPALSQQIRRLEAIVGAPLLYRGAQGARLTPAGEELVGAGRPILDGIGRALAAARRRAAVPQPLRVGFVPGIPQLVLNLLLDSGAEWGGVSLRRIEWAEEAGELLSGRCDVALVQLPFPLDHLEHRPLLLAERVAAFPVGHPLAQRASLTIEELADEPILDAASGRAFWLVDPRPGGRPARVVGPPASSAEEMLASVAAGRGMALTSWGIAESHSRRDVCFVPVDNLDPVVLVAAWAAGGVSPLVHALITQLEASLAVLALPPGLHAAPRADPQ